MKKVLLPLMSMGLVVPLGATLVSCGNNKEPNEVIFQIDNNVTNKSGSPDLWAAYQKIVDNFNQNYQPERKVVLKEGNTNEISNMIASQQKLPSLYLTYADATTLYEQSIPKDIIVDMRSVINWDSEFAKSLDQLKEFENSATTSNQWSTKGETLDQMMGITDNVESSEYKLQHYKPISESFVTEGMGSNGKMYVAPSGKSIMAGTVNLRLLSAIYALATGEENGLTNIVDKNNKEYEINNSDFFGNVEELLTKSEIKEIQSLKMEELFSNNIKNVDYWLTDKNKEKKVSEIFTELFGNSKDLDTIKNTLRNIDNLKLILTVQYKLFGATGKLDSSVYSMGIDDMPGFIYAVNQNITSVKENTNHDQELYQWNNEDPKTLIRNDIKGTKGTTAVLDFLEFANSISDYSNNQHRGGLFALTTGQYGSNYFKDGGMLIYYGSTAGTSHLVNKDTPENLNYKNLAVIGSPKTADGQLNFGAQQGPGIAMFKNGIAEKNEIAVKFVNYFLQAKNLSLFAEKSGYIPSNFYAYNDVKGDKLTPSASKNSDDYEGKGYYYADFTKTGETENAGNFIISGNDIENYAKKVADAVLGAINNNENNNELRLWGSTPSPFGNGVRYEVINKWFTDQWSKIGTGISFELSEFLNSSYWENMVKAAFSDGKIEKK